MGISILFIIVNMLFPIFFNKKKKCENNYDKEKDIFVKNKLLRMLQYINIGALTVELLYIVIVLISETSDLIALGLLILHSISFVFLIFNAKRRKKRLTILDKKEFNLGDIIFILDIIIISLAERLEYGIHNYIFDFIILLILLGTIVLLLLSFRGKNEFICYSIKEKDYLKDIKFANKIQLNKAIGYFVFITMYILFVLAKIDFIYILYIVVGLVLIKIIQNKIKKVGDQTERVYRSISIAKEYPGVEYAFFFTKDIYKLRQLMIILTGFVVTLLHFYIDGEGSFIYITFAIFNLFLYVLINDKYKLIRYTWGLNKYIINTKKYSIIETKKISYIETINIFNTKLYRLIVSDTINYESSIILYDPELFIKYVDIYINKSNLDDYIVYEKYLYMDKDEDLELERQLLEMEEEEEE